MPGSSPAWSPTTAPIRPPTATTSSPSPAQTAYPALARVSQELQRQDPRHLPYINLFPTYASPEQLGTPTYAEHLDRFLRTVKPAVLSYDHTGPIPTGGTRLGVDAPIQLPGDLPLLIGFLADAQGQQYALVVNRDHASTVQATLALKPHVTGLTEISARDGAEKPLAIAERRATLDLEPGGGRLLRLTTQFTYAELPSPVKAVAFEFDAAGDLQGWGGFNSLAEPQLKDGILTLTVTGADPFMVRSFLNLSPDQYAVIEIRMRLGSGNPEAQFFWTTSDEPGFADDKYLNFAVCPDGEWHEYSIPVGTHARWQGKAIRGIRLDPTTGGATRGSTVGIDWIRGR